MARKVIGPTGSRRRRWWFLACLVVTIGAAALFIPGALAVHDTGVFQLDGNALTSIDSSPTALEDWDKVCPAPPDPASRPASDPIHCLGGTTATKHTFITDVYKSGTDDIFKGGTDNADVSTWQWKQATPSPNKADLEQAFAAQYDITTGTYAGHRVLFFGGDRYANNGDTNIGLWFFHSPVGLDGVNSVTAPDGTVSCPVNSGCGFSGNHTVGNISLGGSLGEGCNPNTDPTNNVCTPGDIFILSAFTGGGTEPTIKIFEWVGPGNATPNYLGSNNCFTNACSLQPLPLPAGQGAGCDGAVVTGDVACALVNQSEIDSPWPFQDSGSHTPANKIETNEFYEGGLDLTGLGFGQACFSSVLLNTRSSQSGTSTLQDFALGGFGSCTSGLTTTPSVDGSVDLPTTADTSPSSVTVHDTAVLNVTGVTSFDGTLSFHLCGPFASTDTTSNCSTGGVPVSAVSPTVTTNGSYDSTDVTLTEAGRYCWRGDFTSTTSGVPPASDPSNATNLSECFTVNPVTPGLTTSASANVEIGHSISDTATLNGTANEPGTGGSGDGSINPTTDGAPAGGTITWTAYGPDDCSTVAYGPVTRDVTGDDTYPTASQDAVSFTPTAAGTYTWVASYDSNGSPNNNGVPDTACPDTSGTETVVVSPKQPTLSTQVNDETTSPVAPGTELYDTAHLLNTATPSNSVYGTITLTAYGPEADASTCSTEAYSATFTITGDGYYASNATGATAGGGTFAPTEPGYYNWRAEYTPDSGDVNNLPVGPTLCGADHESSYVRTIPTSIATSQFFYPNDTATVQTDDASALPSGGEVVFSAYAGTVDATVLANCQAGGSTGRLFTQTKPISGDSGSSVSTTNGSDVTDAVPPGTIIYWNVQYLSHSTTYENRYSVCDESSTLTINQYGGPGQTTSTATTTTSG